MGIMYVFGSKPTSVCGAYFRNNEWWWGIMAEYFIMVAPEKCAPCGEWFIADGDGLDAAAAVALAEALQKEVDSGRTETFAQEREATMPMRDEECHACGGTGWRPPGAPRVVDYVRPRTRLYPFSTENVVNFIAFLRDSGGFAIGCLKRC